MCRFILWMGRVDSAAAFEGMRKMSLSRNELQERSTAGTLHDSGWGLAYRAGGDTVIHRSTLPFYNDPARLRYSGITTDFLMLHARKASSGSVAMKNTHPFEREGCIFMHNGSLKHHERLELRPGFKPHGQTDSERLFLHLLSTVDWSRDLESMAECLGRIKDYAALNFVLSTPGAVYACCMHATTPRYYTMKLLKDDKNCIVSSERIPGVMGDWRELQNRTLLRITPDGKVEERRF
jgi:predicted glutamine amidotransferase